MNEEKARKILGDAIKEDGKLNCLSGLTNSVYLSWHPNDSVAVMDGDFLFEELQAIAWWMENHYE